MSLANSAKQLYNAILTPGRSPAFHQDMMRRHRQEWPTLWRAIDKIVEDVGAGINDTQEARLISIEVALLDIANTLEKWVDPPRT